MKKKLIYFFTGKRGGFSHYIPLIKILEKSNQFNYRFVVTDMHLSNLFGKTVNEIKIYTKKIIYLKSNTIQDSVKFRTSVIANTIKSLNDIFDKKKPDFLVLLGDRSEVMGAAISALQHNIPIAHLYGGDLTQGGTDEPTRHAISKLSNIHFTSNKDSYKNIIQMGEEKWRVHNIGLLSLDLLKQKKLKTKKYLEKKFQINFHKPNIVLIQHPVTWQSKKSKIQIKETLKAINKMKIQTVAIYPCSDPGYLEIIKSYKKFEKKDFFKLYKNIDALDFYSLIKYCDLLIGNSSCGITESGFLKKYVLNIGIRQEGRISDKNVFNVEHDSNKIFQKIKYLLQLPKIKKISSIYGTGNSARKILKVLNKNFNKDILIKKKFKKHKIL